MREAILVEKTDRKYAMLIYIFVINTLTLECMFFITKLSSAILNLFPIATILPLEYHLADLRLFLLKL